MKKKLVILMLLVSIELVSSNFIHNNGNSGETIVSQSIGHQSQSDDDLSQNSDDISQNNDDLSQSENEWEADGWGTEKEMTNDRTKSQTTYLEYLEQLELAVPGATPGDIAMGLTLYIWPAGQVYNADGTSDYSPLIRDFAGTSGYKKVLAYLDSAKNRLRPVHFKMRVTDLKKRRSGVAHLYPCVASTEGRNWVSAKQQMYVVTHIGDALQDAGKLIYGLANLEMPNLVRLEEIRDNNRAVAIASEHHDRKATRLSTLLAYRFYLENNGEE